jgi:hypothetical protein
MLASYWDSLEKMSKLNGIVLALAALFGFLAAGFVVASWFTGTRLSNLQDQELNKYKTDAGKDIAKANQLAAEANERAGKLEKEAAELTAKNLELEAAIAPRRLSARQEKGLETLTRFANRLVEIKSYSSDTEGLILATQILDGLTKSKIAIRDNRLTMQPAGSVSFGLSVEGPDVELVQDLRKILSLDGNLTATSSIVAPKRGFSATIGFGVTSGGQPPAATILVGVKPIK